MRIGSFEDWVAREQTRRGIENRRHDLQHIKDFFQAERQAGGLGGELSRLEVWTFDIALLKARRWTDRLSKTSTSEDENPRVLLYADAEWEVAVPETGESARRYAIGTRWCTLNPSTAERYLKIGPLYVIRNKRERDKNGNYVSYQMHFRSDQFMDRNDGFADYFRIVPQRVRDHILIHETVHNLEGAMYHWAKRRSAHPRTRSGRRRYPDRAEAIRRGIEQGLAAEFLNECLLWATKYDYPEIVAAVLSRPERPDLYVPQAMWTASWYGRDEIAVRLLQSQAEIRDGEHFVRIATARKKASTVRLLMADNRISADPAARTRAKNFLQRPRKPHGRNLIRIRRKIVSMLSDLPILRRDSTILTVLFGLLRGRVLANGRTRFMSVNRLTTFTGLREPVLHDALKRLRAVGVVEERMDVGHSVCLKELFLVAGIPMRVFNRMFPRDIHFSRAEVTFALSQTFSSKI